MTSNSAPVTQYSTAPNGEQFPLPTPQDEAAEILRLQALVAEQRALGREIVVVMGVGFVGAVMAGIVAASKVVVLGASYREDVGDTRYSGSEALIRKLAEMGADIGVHDPYVKHWWELERQESYPAPGHSWARFFRNQEGLSELRIEPDLKKALKGADAVVFAVRHEAYLKLDPGTLLAMTGRPIAVIDCFGILDDAAIRRYFELGCEVKGLGRGHVKRIKDAVKR